LRVGRIRELGTDTLIYGLGTVATRVIGFLLIPVYTSYFSPADYGVLALVNMVGTLLMIVIGLGQHTAVFRFYFKYPEASDERRAVVANYLGLSVLMIVPCALLAAFSRPVAGALLGDGSLFGMILVMTGIGYLDLLMKVPLAIIRAKRWTLFYAGYTVLKSLVSIALILYLVVARGWGVMGSLVGELIGAVIFTAVLYVVIRRELWLRISRKILRDMLMFGLPLVVVGLLHFGFRYSNRYFLSTLGTLEDVGQFSLANRFGEIIVFINTAIRTAWPMFLYQSEQERDAARLYGRAMTYYLGLTGLITASLILFIPEVYALMVDPRYHPSLSIVPTMTLTYLFMGVVWFGDIGIKLREKTHYNLWMAVVPAVLSVVLNILLIPRAGVAGAAYATMLAIGVYAVLIVWVSQRLYPVAYEVRRLLVVTAVLTAVTLAGRTIDWGNLPLALAGKTMLLLVGVPLGLRLGGFLNADESRVVRQALARIGVRREV